MAFSWTPVTDGDLIQGDHYNEVKNNIDNLISRLGIAAYSWNRFPKSSGDKIDDQDTQELRDAADYVYDNNVCSSDNSTYYSSVDNSDLSGDLSTNNSGFHGTNYVTVDSGQKSGVDGAYNSGVCGSHFTSVNGSHKTSADSSHFGSDVPT